MAKRRTTLRTATITLTRSTSYGYWAKAIAKILLTSPIVVNLINVPTRASVAFETKGLFFPVAGTFELPKQCL